MVAVSEEAGGEAVRLSCSQPRAAYVKYCDGGSFAGNRSGTAVVNGTSLYYRGKSNLVAIMDDLVRRGRVTGVKRFVLSGCSAGGMACYLHCDFISEYLAAKAPHVTDSKCICDAGVFVDVPSLTGVRTVRNNYFNMVEQMNAIGGLPKACVAAEPDPRICVFSEKAIQYPKTPTFGINSLYNFTFWDLGGLPASWKPCFPKNGALSNETWQHCNETQRAIITEFRETFIGKVNPLWDPASPHGVFLDSCPMQHCQTSTGWNKVSVAGKQMASAVAAWYFEHVTLKQIDEPFPSNPTC